MRTIRSAILLAALAVLATLAAHGQSFATWQCTALGCSSSTFSGPIANGLNVQNANNTYYVLTWTKSGSPTCSVTADSSGDRSSWSAGAVITSQNCGANGSANASNQTLSFIRVTPTISGSGTVNFTLQGFRTPPASGFTAGGDLGGSSVSQTVIGLKSVPFCTGFTPTNGQAVEYTTASAPNPCYTAAAVGTGTITGVTAGTGLGGGGSSGSVTLNITNPFTAQTNTVNNASQAGLNFLTSTANSVGLTVTPVNSATNAMKFEVTGGSYTGNAATATLATNMSGGAAGSLPYQSAVNASAFLAIGGTPGSMLTISSSLPAWDASLTDVAGLLSYSGAGGLSTVGLVAAGGGLSTAGSPGAGRWSCGTGADPYPLSGNAVEIMCPIVAGTEYQIVEPHASATGFLYSTNVTQATAGTITFSGTGVATIPLAGGGTYPAGMYPAGGAGPACLITGNGSGATCTTTMNGGGTAVASFNVGAAGTGYTSATAAVPVQTQLSFMASVPLNLLSSPTGAVPIFASGNNPLVFNCALTSGATCLTTGETTAATTAGAVEHQVTTLTTSTAIPLQLTQGANGPAAANAPAIINVSVAAAGGIAGASQAGFVGAPITLKTGAGSAGGGTTGNGGTGGAFSITTGAGGAAGGNAANTGGVGGGLSYTLGAGTAGAATGNGGAAGSETWTGGTGGAGGATSGTGGAGSDFLVTTGTGGAATAGSTTGRGGNATFTLGAAGGTGTAGLPGGFSIAQGTDTATTATPALSVTATWNNASIAGAMVSYSLTNTSSAAGAPIFQINGGAGGATQEFNVTTAGVMQSVLGGKAGSAGVFGFTAGTLSAAYVSGISSGGSAIVDIGNGTAADTSGLVKAAAFESAGTKFTTNGGCGETSGTTTGGAAAGKYTTSGSTSCTSIITFGSSVAATTGWDCHALDLTTVGDVTNPHQLSSTTTTASIASGTIVSGDVIQFSCHPY